MNNIVIQEKQIQNMIYEIRGKQVMLDSDLAKLYECANGTKDINKAVKRNIERFPEDFYFQLTKEEYYEILRFQSGTLELEQGKYSKYLPYVFTEEGVSMLSGVLHTDSAVEMSKKIIRAFVVMRHFIGNNLLVQNNINNMVIKHDNDIKNLQDTFDKFIKPEENNHIFFEGQIYDAYSLLIDIFNKSKSEIIIIDNYADRKLLDILCKIDKKVIIYSKNMDEELIKKYNKQYNNVEVKYNNKFHDRFIIMDRCILYHTGASFKDLGTKCFGIHKLEDKEYLNRILEEINIKG